MIIDNKMTVVEAANYLRLSVSHLNKLRVRGGGPKYFKFGRRVVYGRADLDYWAELSSRRSTADAPRLQCERRGANEPRPEPVANSGKERAKPQNGYA